METMLNKTIKFFRVFIVVGLISTILITLIGAFHFLLFANNGFEISSPPDHRLAILIFTLLLLPFAGLILRRFLNIRSALLISVILFSSGFLLVFLWLLYFRFAFGINHFIKYQDLHLEEAIWLGIFFAVAGLFVFSRKKEHQNFTGKFNSPEVGRQRLIKNMKHFGRKALRIFLGIITVVTALTITLRWDQIRAYSILRKTDYTIAEMNYNASGLKVRLQTEVKGKSYDILFEKVKSGSFKNSQTPLIITEINGYTIIGCSCDGGLTSFPFAINIKKNRSFYYYFDIKELNILWFMENIVEIERKFMEIPTHNYLHMISPDGTEDYFKRILYKNFDYNVLAEDLKKDHTLFVFDFCPDPFFNIRRDVNN